MTTADAKTLTLEIEAIAGDLSACFLELSPAARRNALKLAHSLGNLRRKIATVAGIPVTPKREQQ